MFSLLHLFNRRRFCRTSFSFPLILRTFSLIRRTFSFILRTFSFIRRTFSLKSFPDFVEILRSNNAELFPAATASPFLWRGGFVGGVWPPLSGVGGFGEERRVVQVGHVHERFVGRAFFFVERLLQSNKKLLHKPTTVS